MWKEHTTNKSWKTFALSFKDFKKKKKNQLVSRDPNVTSHCPTNTIQKVPNFSTFMRPHSILQCLVSVVKSAHIYKHVRQQFIYLTWKQLAFSPPQFHLTLAFFFFSCNATSNSWWWSENHESHILCRKLWTPTNVHNTKHRTALCIKVEVVSAHKWILITIRMTDQCFHAPEKMTDNNVRRVAA